MIKILRLQSLNFKVIGKGQGHMVFVFFFVCVANLRLPSITSRNILSFKVMNKRSRSHGFLCDFCVRDAAATRRQYLALSKGFTGLFRIFSLPGTERKLVTCRRNTPDNNPHFHDTFSRRKSLPIYDKIFVGLWSFPCHLCYNAQKSEKVR